jgi:Protein of unknown function (DUF4236)
MGWGFKRSINIGPLRINFSKSGISFSVGGKGVRTGVDAEDRRYTSLNLPGTGLFYRMFNRRK